jgi:hypothetical protein
MSTGRFDLIGMNPRNYGKDIRATLLFKAFGVINRILTKKEPFASGAFFFTRRDVFNSFGGFEELYSTCEDYMLSRKYDTSRFLLMYDQHYGQDERRFVKMGYIGMMKYMIQNFFNRNKKSHFENMNVRYWE